MMPKKNPLGHRIVILPVAKPVGRCYSVIV